MSGCDYGAPFDRIDGVHDDLTAGDVTNAVAVAGAAVRAVSPG